MLTTKSKWKNFLIIAGMLAPALIIAVGIVIYPIINTIITSFSDAKTGAFTLANYTYLFTNKLARAHVVYGVDHQPDRDFCDCGQLSPGAVPAVLRQQNLTVYQHPVSAAPLYPGPGGRIRDENHHQRLRPLKPAVAAAAGGQLLYNLKPGLLYNASGIILMNLWFNIPFATMIITAALSGISTSIIESARDVGAGKIRIFFKMILPLSLGDVMIAATFVFMSNISSFTTPYLIGANHPMMLGVYLRKQFSSRNYELAAAVSVLIFLFSAVSAIVYIHTNLKEKEWQRH